MGRGPGLGALVGAWACRTSTTSRCRADAATPRDHDTSWPAGADLIGEEPVAELGVVTVGVEDGVRQVGLGELGGR